MLSSCSYTDKRIIWLHQHCAMVMVCHYIISNRGLQIRYAKNAEENLSVAPRNAHIATTLLHLIAAYSVRQVINSELLMQPPSLPPNKCMNELCLYAQKAYVPYAKTTRTSILITRMCRGPSECVDIKVSDKVN